MATPTLNGFLQHLRKAMAAETLAAHADGELIGRFLASHDEASFHALLRRHGPMVLRICRRSLSDEQDVEDAFQATFLVLARDANAIRKRASLASWLHGVAHRVALDARKANARRRKHEAEAATCADSAPLTDEVGWKELRSVLDEELVKLPDRLRAPLVLCYLEGLTQDEAAARLGQSKCTFRRNLERGRELLGARLTRRGVTLSAALVGVLLSECAASAVPPALAASTTAAAAALTAGKAVAALASARALALARGLAQPALSAKMKAVCAVLFATSLAGFGVAVVANDNGPVESTPPAERQHVAKAAAIKAPEAAKVDEPKPAKRIGFQNPLLVLRAEVQTELKLTAEQVRKIRDVVHEIDARVNEDAPPPKPLQPGSRAEPAEATNKRVAETVRALREVLAEILTDAQTVRLRQLEMQVVGMSAFLDPENVKLLALTDEQHRKVQGIVAQARQVQRQRPDSHRQAGEAAVQQILELLTADQRKTWRDLAGEEFDIFHPPSPRPPVREGVPVVPPQQPDPDGKHDR